MPEVMNLTNKLYQLPVLERIAETDWARGNTGPLVVELDPTAACDLACPGCISEDVIAAGGRFGDERLMELGREMIASGVRAVILIGGGEPLAHRKIGDFINLLGEGGVHVGITTNGTFLERCLDPIARHARWTRVSMDAATEATYRVLRPAKGVGGSKWHKVLTNIRLLAAALDAGRRGGRRPGELGYSFLIQTPADGPGICANVHEIYEAAVLARDLGCDYFEVKPTYQFREGVPHALTRHDPDLMARAAEQVERLDALTTSSFRVIKAINLRHSLGGVTEEQPKGYRHCPSTHLRTTVTPKGVYVCPYWRGKERMKVGDVTRAGFAEVWDGERRKKVMERLDPSVDCNFHCLRHDTNLLADDLKRRQEGGAEITAVEEFDRFI